MGLMDELKKIIHPYDDEDYDYEDDFEEPVKAVSYTHLDVYKRQAEGAVADIIRRTQVDALSPLEALNLLYELKSKLQ